MHYIFICDVKKEHTSDYKNKDFAISISLDIG